MKRQRDEESKSDSDCDGSVFEHAPHGLLNEYYLVSDFRLDVCLDVEGRARSTKKCFPKSNELLRMLVRIFVLDYRMR